MKVLLGYRRKSMVRHQADMISPERQARSCELWVEMQNEAGEGYAIEWFEDVDGHRSGREEKNRPGWQALLREIKRPDVAGVIADSFDRMYRNVHQFLNFLNKLEELDKKLITVKEGLDTSSTLGRAIVTILMVIYQLESDQTSDRMAANVKYKREVLGRHWGPTPFGCDRDEAGHLIPTERRYWLNALTGEARLSEASPGDGWELRRYHEGLVEVYRLYGTGSYSYDSVAVRANEAGWRYYAEAKGGKPRPFTRDDIRRLVSFWQLYRGELPTGNITNDRDAPVLAGGHEPILPVEMCDQVGLVRKKRGYKPRPRTPEQRSYLLGDVLFCAVCEQPLNGQWQDGTRRYRHHGKKGCPERWLKAEEIERQVLDMLTELANNELLIAIVDEADRLARSAFAQNKSTRPLVEELEKQNRRLTRLEDLYLDAAIDKERYLTRKAGIDREIGRLEDDLYAATQTINFKPTLTRMTATLDQLDSATPETKKTLINSMIERLEVGGGQIIRFVPRPWASPFF